MAVLKGNFQRKTKAVSQVGEGISTLYPELQKWSTAQAIILQLVTSVWRGFPCKLREGFGKGRGHPLVASQNLPSFQARKRLWKICWKLQLGAYKKNCVSGQDLKLNWSSKRKNRRVGNAQRTAELQVCTHTHGSFCISTLILFKQLGLFFITTFGSPCPEFKFFRKTFQNCNIYSEYYPFMKAVAILHCCHVFIF